MAGTSPAMTVKVTRNGFLVRSEATWQSLSQWDTGMGIASLRSQWQPFACATAQRNSSASGIMRHGNRTLAVYALALAGCTPPTLPCARLGGAPMLEYQLFFGRGPVTDQTWSEFAAAVVTPHLPDGFTVVDADG
jgi:Protein of unknown function (DUF3574)